MVRRCGVLAATVLVLVVAGAGVGGVEMDEEMAELARMVREECIAETGADVSLVERVNAGEAVSAHGALGCYIKCVMETAGMLSEGEVDVDAVLALLPDSLRDKNEAALRACGTQRGQDDCETALRTQACWQDANKVDYFLI